jgi:hypothetical protein
MPAARSCCGSSGVVAACSQWRPQQRHERQSQEAHIVFPDTSSQPSAKGASTGAPSCHKTLYRIYGPTPVCKSIVSRWQKNPTARIDPASTSEGVIASWQHCQLNLPTFQPLPPTAYSPHEYITCNQPVQAPSVSCRDYQLVGCHFEVDG